MARFIMMLLMTMSLSACGVIRYDVNGTWPINLIVADYQNNRVLIWNTFPTVNQQPADVVLGQPDMNTGGVNTGGRSAVSLSLPFSIFNDGSRISVADQSNNRVLVFSSSLFLNQRQPAALVLGQSNFSTGGNATTASGLNNPLNAITEGGRLIAADYQNNRVLIWNQIPTQSGQAADVVIGQPNMTSNMANNGGPDGRGLSQPYAARVINGRFYVVDKLNSRILIWNSIPTTSFQAADLVLGQPNFTSVLANAGGAASAATLNLPTDVYSDGNRLYVADRSNSRILIWNSIPTTTQQPADVVIGQPSFASTGPGTTSQLLNAPTSSYSDGVHFYVGDTSNHRVLIWNSIPYMNQAPADIVLGQPDMTSGLANAGGAVSSQTLNFPAGIGSNVKVNGVARPGGY